jgi:uncharacterized membrane protein YhiD involved in acid resistance
MASPWASAASLLAAAAALVAAAEALVAAAAAATAVVLALAAFASDAVAVVVARSRAKRIEGNQITGLKIYELMDLKKASLSETKKRKEK